MQRDPRTPDIKEGCAQPAPLWVQAEANVDARDVNEALQIIRDAQADNRALTSEEDRRLSIILTNLGLARSRLAEILKDLARSSSDTPPLSPPESE